MRVYAFCGVVSLVALSSCGLLEDSSLVLTANDYCGINAPIGPAPFDRTIPIQPWGWGFDKATGKIPEKISLQIISEDNKIGIKSAMTRVSRPDVAKAFERPELDMSGYGGKIDVSTLPPGVYVVSLVQSDGARISVCTSPSKIVLK